MTSSGLDTQSMQYRISATLHGVIKYMVIINNNNNNKAFKVFKIVSQQ